MISGVGSLAFIALAIPMSLTLAGFGAAMVAIFLQLSIVCNYPHYAATYAVVVRERGRSRRAVWWLAATAPVVLSVLVAAVVWPAALLAPLAHAYLTLSPHHYAAQHFGVAALHSTRHGRPFDRTEKRLLRWSFLGVGGFMMLMVNTITADADQRLVGVPQADYALWLALPPVTHEIALGLVGLSLVFLWLADRRVRRRTRRGMHPLVWLMFAINFVWFVVPNVRLPGEMRPWTPPELGLALVAALPFFHCAQYLGVVGHRMRGSGPVRPIALLTVLAAGGMVMFAAIPYLAVEVTAVDMARATLVASAAFNLHHFLLDAIIWRRPATRTAEAVPATA